MNEVLQPSSQRVLKITVPIAVGLVALWAILQFTDQEPPNDAPQSAQTPASLRDSGGSTALVELSPPVTSRDELRELTLAPPSFNPTQGGLLTSRFRLLTAQKLTIRLWDDDDTLIRTLATDIDYSAGIHEFVWDGKDDKGIVVPDEAYRLTFHAGALEIVDSSWRTPGQIGDLTKVDVDSLSKVLRYELPHPSRVLIRLGLKDGPMLKTLVDWRVRMPGSVVERWDGWDESHAIEMAKDPRFTGVVTYATLPVATVVTFGNRELSYREFKLQQRKSDGTHSPKRSLIASASLANPGSNSPAGLVPPAWARAPAVLLDFPELATATDTANTAVLRIEARDTKALKVRVEVDPSDREMLLNDQFEVMFFVNGDFLAEAERGYLPFLWSWDLSQLQPGEHLLTTNIVSFAGQVGVASRRILIVGSSKQ